MKKVMDRLDLPLRTRTKIRADLTDFRRQGRELAIRKDLSPSRVYRLMAESSTEALLLLMALSQEERAKRYVSDYLTTYSRTTTHLRGKDLRTLGIKPGPIYKRILNTLLYARLDGKVETREDELRLIRSKFRAYLPPRP